jgi:hypothetical protein
MTDTRDRPPEPAIDRARPVLRSHWWREVVIVVVFYGLYTLVRDVRSNRPVSYLQAFTNAKRVIRVERFLGIFREQQIQHWFLHDRSFIRFWNDYYGTAHFVVPIAVLVMLFFWYPAHYRLWRNTLAVTNLVALAGFTLFPLMPPRLLPPSYHFVDTLQQFGGLWNFSSGPVNQISNQYAAMPSLHTAWALWCAMALFPVLRAWWAKALVLVYPLATIFCIVVTANHFFVDEVAGIAVLGASYVAALRLTLKLDQRHNRRELGMGHELAPPPPDRARLS